MKSKFQFYKNIILLVASALTLIAVTFAWFSNYDESWIPVLETPVSSGVLKVDFQEDVGDGNYEMLDGDIVLDGMVAGSYSKYRILVTPDNPVKLSMVIDGLPDDMSDELKNSVNIKYTLKCLVKGTDASGKVSYTDGEVISESNGYVPLSELTSGVIFGGISLKNYQEDTECFAIYYEIGLSEDSPVSISGAESSLGDVIVSGQIVE